MKSIAVIPARGGSVRIPGKNIRLFHGLPIVVYSIRAAWDSGLFDDVVVSTDSLDIAAVAGQYDATVFLRSSDDGSRGTQEVAKEVLDALEHEGMCCVIYATAPMLTGDVLKDAHEAWMDINPPYLVPVGKWLSDPGMFYMGLSSAFRLGTPLTDAGLFAIDPRTAIDINVESDWLEAERMYAELHGIKTVCCGHIHSADAGGVCSDCPDTKERI